MSRYYFFAVLPSFFAAFAWFYLGVQGTIIQSALFGGNIALCLAYLGRLYKLRLDKKHSGLSNDDYLLGQSGRATSLLNDASLIQAIGWVCIAVPVALVLFCLISGSRQAAALAGIISGAICVPCALICFRSASKCRRLAKSAEP